MGNRQQILIVLWKWENLNGGVNARIFREKKLEKHVGQIDLGRGKYFEEYPVEHSELCPHAKFVQANIYKDDEQTDRLFFALLERYISPESEVLVFLHRAHFYDEKDVAEIRAKFGKNNLKCFLFADGRDYIYYNTQKSGLLNDTGGFFIQRDLDTDEYIETFDEDRKIIKQPYFDRVWTYYRHEFQSKTFELKEELFNCWFELLLPGQSDMISVDDIEGRLKQLPYCNRNLLYRIKSFLGHYKTTRHLEAKAIEPQENFKSKNEVREVEKLERKEGKSYLFDDDIANLAIEKERDRPLVIEAYEETGRVLQQILFSSETHVSKNTLRDLANRFNLLVQSIPGEMSN